MESMLCFWNTSPLGNLQTDLVTYPTLKLRRLMFNNLPTDLLCRLQRAEEFIEAVRSSSKEGDIVDTDKQFAVLSETEPNGCSYHLVLLWSVTDGRVFVTNTFAEKSEYSSANCKYWQYLINCEDWCSDWWDSASLSARLRDLSLV